MTYNQLNKLDRIKNLLPEPAPEVVGILTQELRRFISSTIILESKGELLRDGGSLRYNVINKNECGYTSVIQDRAINTKTYGAYFGVLLEVAGEKEAVYAHQLCFV